MNYGYDNADQLTGVTDFNNHQITITPNADGLTADAAGRPVLAGPVEATALGNVLVQARA